MYCSSMKALPFPRTLTIAGEGEASEQIEEEGEAKEIERTKSNAAPDSVSNDEPVSTECDAFSVDHATFETIVKPMKEKLGIEVLDAMSYFNQDDEDADCTEPFDLESGACALVETETALEEAAVGEPDLLQKHTFRDQEENAIRNVSSQILLDELCRRHQSEGPMLFHLRSAGVFLKEE
jgi:hypothetical protein